MMKQLLIIFFFVFFSHTSFSQELNKSSIPTDVKTQLDKLYIDADKINWYKEEGQYIADFRHDKIFKTAFFDRAGNLLKSEEQCQVAELPERARDYALNKFPQERILGARKITDNTGRVQWVAAMKSVDFLFDKDGNFIK